MSFPLMLSCLELHGAQLHDAHLSHIGDVHFGRLDKVLPDFSIL